MLAAFVIDCLSFDSVQISVRLRSAYGLHTTVYFICPTSSPKSR